LSIKCSASSRGPDPGKDLEELRKIDTKAREVRRKYFEGLNRATAGELAVHRRVNRLNYSKRCAYASVQAHMKQGLPLFLDGDRICSEGCQKVEVDPARTGSISAYYHIL